MSDYDEDYDNEEDERTDDEIASDEYESNVANAVQEAYRLYNKQ